jgi:hypothetical protein
LGRGQIVAVPDSQPTNIGKYQITDLLGLGAMGVVYRALDPALNRYVAVKVMTQGIAADAELRDRFMREARAAGSLQHPNIITIYDFGDSDGYLYIAMEYVEGADLSDIMERGDPLPLTGKIDIMVDVLHALDYAHSRHVVHRDVKPGNIRVSVDGRAKLMDFGIARLEKSDLTRSGVMIGTPDYMAPEQVTSGEISAATDVFAVGVVLYEFLTHRRTFEGDTLHAVLYKVVHDQPPPLKDVDARIPASLQPVLDKALAKDPAARYQSAGAMARDLSTVRTALSGAATVRVEERATPLRTARVEAPLRMPWAKKKKRVVMLIGAGGGVLLAAAVGAWLLLSPRSGRPPAVERPADAYAAAVRSAPAAPAGQPTAPVLPHTPAAGRETTAAAPSSAMHAASPSVPRGPRGAGLQPAPAATEPAAPVVTGQPAGQAAPQAAPQPASQQAQQASPQPAPPPQPAEPADPRPQIEQLVDTYARAIESRSVAEIRRVYPGLTSQQQQGWERFFQTVRSLKVRLAITQLDLSGGAADLTVSGSYDYDAGGGTAPHPVSFHATAAQDGGSWKIRTVR